MSPKDRQEFEERFGKLSSFSPENFTSISYRGKTLYDADIFLPNEPEDLLVQFRTKNFEESSFLLSLDIKDMQKRYIPEKARFYRFFSRFRGVIFLSRNVDENRLFRSLSGTELP